MRARSLLLLAVLASASLAAALPPALPGLPSSVHLPPWAAPAGAGPFSTVTCPFLGHPSADHPLELCNSRATSQVGPASEISMAMDPANPAHLVVAAKGFNYTRLLGSSFLGGVITPYATTFDGGLTWTQGYLQPLDQVYATLPNGLQVGETTKHESDPVVGWGQDGQPLIMTLRVNQGGGLPVYRSSDDGRTFAQIGSAFNGGTDKEWFVRDPTTGNLYAGTLGNSGGIDFVKSTDGGRTWSAPRNILGGSYVTLDVGPHGEIYVASNYGSSVHFTRSLDQGATWSAERSIGPRSGAGNPADFRAFRTPDFAELAASKTDGSVYAVVTLPGGALPNAGPLQDWGIFVFHSTDYGVTWGAPVRVDDGAPGFKFMPEVAVSPKGDVHVAWLDQRHDFSGLTVTAYYAHSSDHGNTWGPSLLLSDLPFLSTLGHHQELQNGIFIGDYMGLSASDDRAVVAFPDTRYGRPDIFVATIV